jgi:t-SNARE complex subunit (syntaxin)
MFFDLTPDFVAQLRSAATGGGGSRQTTSLTTTSFHKQANAIREKINKTLLVCKEYVSMYADFSPTTGMTDEQRDEIDGVLMESLRECEDLIRKQQSRDSEEDNQSTINHCKSVSLLLQDAVKDAQRRVNNMRMLRQGHVMAARDKFCPVITDYDHHTVHPSSPTTQPDLVANLSPEEIQALEQENKDLEEALQNEFEEILKIEKSAQEVSELLAAFSYKVEEQHETIETLFSEAQSNVEVINQVPEELHQATERSAGFRRMMLILLLGLGGFLLLMDLLA